MKSVWYVVPPEKQMESVSYVVSEMKVRGFFDESFAIKHDQKIFYDDKEKVKEILNKEYLNIERFCCILSSTSEMTFLLFSPSSKKKRKYTEKYFYHREEFEAIHKMCSRFSKNDRR